MGVVWEVYGVSVVGDPTTHKDSKKTMEDSKMNEIKSNVPKTLTDRVSRKLVYFFVLAALVATAAVGYTFLPEAGTVSAQARETKDGADADAPEVATQAMLDFALNLHSASEYAVYAQKGIVDNGGSDVRGNKGSALRSEAGDRKSVV